MTATRVFVGVGGNVEPERVLPEALAALSSRVAVRALSTFYRTEALHRPEQPEYLNGVLELRYDGDARSLKFDILRDVEAAFGRKRGPDAYAPRTVDLDILLFGRVVLKEDDLVIPDPQLSERTFLLASLLELEPDLLLPGPEIRLEELLDLDEAHALVQDEAFTRSLRKRLKL